MSKKVTESAVLTETNRFGPNKDNLFVVCDDGTAYQFQKFRDAPNWVLRGRWEGSEFKPHKGRLPKYVELHMDGRTYRSGGDWAA